MSKESVQSILTRFIHNKIDPNTLEQWANDIEGRDDIDYDESFSQEINQLIFDIANQEIQGTFDKETAVKWFNTLNKSP